MAEVWTTASWKVEEASPQCLTVKHRPLTTLKKLGPVEVEKLAQKPSFLSLQLASLDRSVAATK